VHFFFYFPFLFISRSDFLHFLLSCVVNHHSFFLKSAMSALITLVASFATGLVADVTPPSLPSLLRGMPNVSEFTTLLGSPAYSSLFLNLSSNDRNWVTILAPTNEAFAKLPYSSFGAAFENNDTHVIEEVLRYHVLQGACPTQSHNGTSDFFSTWLDDTPVTNGQVVGPVQQNGGANVFTSGLGERSTLVYPVRASNRSIPCSPYQIKQNSH